MLVKAVARGQEMRAAQEEEEEEEEEGKEGRGWG
jgi:hypothetical protein